MDCRFLHMLFIILVIVNPENFLDFVRILSEELVSAGVLPEDYNFEDT